MCFQKLFWWHIQRFLFHFISMKGFCCYFSRSYFCNCLVILNFWKPYFYAFLEEGFVKIWIFWSNF
jgi:hypothetical protein